MADEKAEYKVTFTRAQLLEALNTKQLDDLIERTTQEAKKVAEALGKIITGVSSVNYGEDGLRITYHFGKIEVTEKEENNEPAE